MFIIPVFFIGKFISDMIMVYAGKYATENAISITHGLLSWKTITGASFGLILICAVLFIDWSKFLIKKKLELKFNIWK